jgi:hypothetical protein
MLTKNFLFPQNMVRADEMNGFFGGTAEFWVGFSGIFFKKVQ